MARFFGMLMAAFLLISAVGATLTTPTITGAANGTSGTTYSYSTLVDDQIQYNISWGDGTSSTSSLTNAGTSASLSHTWTVPAGTTKTFVVTSTVNDAVSEPFSVTIAGPATTNRPPATPSIPSGTMSGKAGYPYRYYTKATDPDSDKVKYTFDWGDGTTSSTALVSSGASASSAHVWEIPPGSAMTFDVRARTTDEHGAVSGWSGVQPVIIVLAPENHPPTVPTKPTGSTSGITGATYSYSSSSTDPDGNHIKYIFDWGDGSTETGYFPTGQTVTASHSWNVPAGKIWSYNVRVTAFDSHNQICPPPYWSDYLRVTITGP